MKKTFFRRSIVFIAILIAAISCEQEPLNVSAVDCPACPADLPNEGTVVIYCPDLIVNSVISYGRTGNIVKYGVVIKNIGNVTAPISNLSLVSWQAWLSKDGVSRDVPACGSSFNQPLPPGQLAVQRINCTFPSTVNLNLYKSMIVVLKVPASFKECSTSNNIYVRTPPPF